MAVFEWDLEKAKGNLKKHGISFELAITAFDDPDGLIAPDENHSGLLEQREWLIGFSDVGVLVVVFTLRYLGTKIRIISARRANGKERKIYEKTKGLSFQ